jgi:hypothetical protein
VAARRALHTAVRDSGTGERKHQAVTFDLKYLKGFLGGLGGAAFVFLLYKKNQHLVESFLQNCGYACGSRAGEDLSSLSIGELREKIEHIEDLIAEREMRGHTADPKS